MTYRLLTDDDVDRHLTMAEAVACMNQAFLLHAAGQLAAPGRIAADLQEAGNLVFTVGGTRGEGGVAGFRVYDLAHLGVPGRDELVALFSGDNGALLGLVAGERLGPIRTGAIGGVAIDALARADANVLGLIGTGPQAETQLAAALCVRDFTTIRAFSRNPERRSDFATRMSDKLGHPIQAVDSAQAAVDDADVIITATISPMPVLSADWLKPGVHINNIGPKFKDQQELDLQVAKRAGLLVTDTKAQVAKTGERFMLQGTEYEDHLVELSSLMADKNRPPRGDEISLFYSLGLAGTEVLLAARLLELCS